jgi:Rho GDP-dissociation inhibitor
MSGFVETLVSTNVHPMKTKKEEEAVRQRTKTKDEDVEGKEHPNMDLVSPCTRDGKDIHRRKEQYLEPLNTSRIAESGQVPDVQFMTLSIVCPGRPEIALSQPFLSSPKACLFTLKEGTKYRLKFSFIVSNRVVSGLRYENTLWKSGVRVDRTTVLLGTFNPRKIPYGYQLCEDTLPTGILVRGLYSAKAKVVDNDGRSYMDIHYHFDIQKKWPTPS